MSFFFHFTSSDKLREGDELLEVNGVPVAGKRTEDIIHLMVSLSLPCGSGG